MNITQICTFYWIPSKSVIFFFHSVFNDDQWFIEEMLPLVKHVRRPAMDVKDSSWIREQHHSSVQVSWPLCPSGSVGISGMQLPLQWALTQCIEFWWVNADGLLWRLRRWRVSIPMNWFSHQSPRWSSEYPTEGVIRQYLPAFYHNGICGPLCSDPVAPDCSTFCRSPNNATEDAWWWKIFPAALNQKSIKSSFVSLCSLYVSTISTSFEYVH